MVRNINQFFFEIDMRKANLVSQNVSRKTAQDT